MEYLINEFDSVVNSTTDASKVIYVGNGITIEYFYLKKGTTLMEGNEETPEGRNDKRTICYIIQEGKLEYWLGDEKVVATKGESITIMQDKNFSVWALENTIVISVHNCNEPDIDNTPAELVEAVAKVELKDTYLKGHNYRVGKYSTLIMQIICPEKSGYLFCFTATYHDVGKLVVPEEILNKNGRLTDEEFEEIKKHPVASYEMLKNYVGNKVANYARWHHEKLDGSGYPDKIKGDEIPLESRVMAVADIFDALTTSRCYRKSFTFEEALEIMDKDVKNGKLDGNVFAVLKKLVLEGKIVDGVDNLRATSSVEKELKQN